MEQRKIEKFQVIGACVKMQTVSLEEEIELMDGIPYGINFCDDFSEYYVYERPIEEVPIPEIIEAILKESRDASPTDNDIFTTSNYQQSQKFWNQMEKQSQKDYKKEKKRKKRKGHPRSVKEAQKNFDRIVDELMKG